MKELQDDGATQRRPSSSTRGFISANMISADSPEIERCNEMDAAIIGGWLRDELEAADWRLYGAALLEVLSAGRRGEEEVVQDGFHHHHAVPCDRLRVEGGGGSELFPKV